MLQCQRDPTQRRLDTEVLSCEPAGDHYSVVLSDTILYPEGGGQPADRGRIAGVEVLDVQRVSEAVVHTTVGPVSGAVRVEVSWARRFDHMQQHTAQHLLTAIAHDRFGWSTTSFHLYEERCDIELDTPGIAPFERDELQARVNAEIRSARPVGIRVVDPETLAQLNVRIRGLDPSLQQIRLIDIQGVDLNTCGGTHVSNTAEIGGIQLLETEGIRGGTRLYFIAGDRIGASLRACLTREASLSRILSTGPSGHVAAVEKLLSDSKSANKVHRATQAELATCLGAELARSEAPVLTLHRDTADLGFLNQVATSARALCPDKPLLLTSGTASGVFLAIAAPEVLAPIRDALLAVFDGRGGGPPGRLQGRGARIDRRSSAVELLSG
jgi:misacylated tRNA(Ala) deacylase